MLGEASASGDACASLAAGGPSGGGGELGAGSLAGAIDSGLGTGSVLGGTLENRALASQLALQCPPRRLTLIDVLQRGNHVALLGAADKSLIGRKVPSRCWSTTKAWPPPWSAPTASLVQPQRRPRTGWRFTNRASYQASIGAERSQYLKLNRRMLVESIASRAGKVTIRGRVVRPLTQRIARILIQRRISCSSVVTVKRIKPNRNGAFTVTLAAPTQAHAAVYIAVTRVRQSVRNRKTYPTSTLPRVVVIR